MQSQHPLVQDVIRRGYRSPGGYDRFGSSRPQPWSLGLLQYLIPTAKPWELIYHALRLMGLGYDPQTYIGAERFGRLRELLDHQIFHPQCDRDWQEWRGGAIANASPRMSLWTTLVLLDMLGPTEGPDEKEWNWFEQWLERGQECLTMGYKVDQACFDTLKAHFRRG